MKIPQKWRSPLLLFGMALLVHAFSYFPQTIENQYTAKIFPIISQLQRGLLGWLPVSVGDLLYGLLLLWLLIALLRGIWQVKQLKKANWQALLPIFAKRFLLLYLVFSLLWGLNYSRMGIAHQMSLKLATYSNNELYLLDSLLLQKTNACKLKVARLPPTTKDSFAQIATTAYHNMGNQYAFINYHPAAIKPSLWGWLGNYLGFLGYYNPFTGEAQVNTTVPSFLQPFVYCHEIAHQLGYAKEDEANFVGFLAASQSGHPFFEYSAYLDMWLYSQRNLYLADSVAARRLSKQLLPAVQQDIKEWQAFNNRHQNPAEPVVKWLYAFYLKRNNQPAGILSYDAVVGYLVAYQKKHGHL
jgi:hypothetical protein